MTKEKMNHNTDHGHQERERLALRLHSTNDQRHGNRNTSPSSQDHRHRLEELRSTTEGTEGWNRPQQLPNPTDTAPPIGEPPLHLGHEIGPHLSDRPAEVANRQRPPPNSHQEQPRATTSFSSTVSEQGSHPRIDAQQRATATPLRPGKLDHRLLHSWNRLARRRR
jgi:hypothetical protein